MFRLKSKKEVVLSITFIDPHDWDEAEVSNYICAILKSGRGWLKFQEADILKGLKSMSAEVQKRFKNLFSDVEMIDWTIGVSRTLRVTCPNHSGWPTFLSTEPHFHYGRNMWGQNILDNPSRPPKCFSTLWEHFLSQQPDWCFVTLAPSANNTQKRSHEATHTKKCKGWVAMNMLAPCLFLPVGEECN